MFEGFIFGKSPPQIISPKAGSKFFPTKMHKTHVFQRKKHINDFPTQMNENIWFPTRNNEN